MVNLMLIKIQLTEFIDSFKDSLGLDGAKELLQQALLDAGLPYQRDYSKEEALKLCQELKKKAGFIGIVGGILASRIIIR